jgi:hypothetical protein
VKCRDDWAERADEISDRKIEKQTNLRGIVLLLKGLRCEDTHGAQEETFR